MKKRMTNSKKILTNRQYERDMEEGKLPYKKRRIEEYETKQAVREFIRCSCLDSAFERQAIDSGLVKDPVFPENKQYMKQKKQ